MRKHAALLLLLLLVVSNISTATAQILDKTTYYELDGVQYYKNTIGYDKITNPDDTILVNSQRYTIEYLSGKNWKQITTPTTLTRDTNQLKREYTDYAGTTAEVIYTHKEDGAIKTDIAIHSSEKRTYRIVWSLDGITPETVQHGVNYVEFYQEEKWVRFDWNDAYAQYGDITNYTVEETANGKKLDIIFNIGEVGAGETVILDPVVYTSNTPSNNDYKNIYGVNWVAQSFTIDNDTPYISQVTLKLYRIGTPGTITVGIRAVDGGGAPTGGDLTNGTINGDTLTTSTAGADYDITLTPYQLSANTTYAIVVRAPTAGADRVRWRGTNYNTYTDGETLTSGDSGVSWVGSTTDRYFEVWVVAVPVVNNITGNTLFTKDQYGWLNVTVTDEDGVADLTRVDTTIILNGNNTIVLRWTQATDTFSEVSDPDNVCTLDVATSESVNLDANTVRLGYYIMFTSGATEGTGAVSVYALDDLGLENTTGFPSAFEYTAFDWNAAVYDLINSAFGFFGIAGYMQQAIDFTDSISANFTNSLTGLATLINLQFQVIWATFGFFTDWATRIIDRAIMMGELMRDIMNGVALGTEDVWAFFEFDTWAPDVVPLAAILYWIDSIYKRGPTQGYTTVLWGDLQNMANVFAFFIGAFSMVIGFIEDKVNWVIQALP